MFVCCTEILPWSSDSCKCWEHKFTDLKTFVFQKLKTCCWSRWRSTHLPQPVDSTIYSFFESGTWTIKRKEANCFCKSSRKCVSRWCLVLAAGEIAKSCFHVLLRLAGTKGWSISRHHFRIPRRDLGHFLTLLGIIHIGFPSWAETWMMDKTQRSAYHILPTSQLFTFNLMQHIRIHSKLKLWLWYFLPISETHFVSHAGNIA